MDSNIKNSSLIKCYKFNGDEVPLDECDYIRIEMLGKHAEELGGKYALVSINDYKYVMDHKWYLGKDLYPMAYRNKKDNKIRGCSMKMHKFLYKCHNILIPKGYVVDHINHDRLDNRFENLRLCTSKENSYNTSKRNGKYKGVRSNKNGTYSVTINKDGKRHQINNIFTEIDAAKLYDIMAEELFGEYAGKNFNDKI